MDIIKSVIQFLNVVLEEIIKIIGQIKRIVKTGKLFLTLWRRKCVSNLSFIFISRRDNAVKFCIDITCKYMYMQALHVLYITHVHTAYRPPKVSFPYLCFDWSEVMFVSCTNITSNQPKHRYGKYVTARLSNEIIVSNAITGCKKQPACLQPC